MLTHNGIRIDAIAMVRHIHPSGPHLSTDKPVLVAHAGDDAHGPAPLNLYRFRVAYITPDGLGDWWLVDSMSVVRVHCGALPWPETLPDPPSEY